MEENTNENKPVAEVMPEPEKEETEVAIQPVETEVPAEEKPAEPSKEEPQKIVVDFDYDKLAEAIIKAQERYKEKELKDKAGKKDVSLNNITAVFSYVLSYVEMFLGVLVFAAMIIAGKTMIWGDAYTIVGNVVALLLYVILTVLVLLVSGWTRKIAYKIKNEPDRNYTVSVFSGLAAFAGLVIAGISLLLSTRG